MKAVLITALVLGLGMTTAAAEETASVVTLRSLLEEAARTNPGLQAAWERVKAAEEAPASAGALPDPGLSVSQMAEHIETRGGPAEGTIGLSQKVPAFGKRALRAQAALKHADFVGQGFRAEALKVRSDVTAAYYELYYLRQSVVLLNEQVDLLRHFARVAEKKYSVGKTPQAMVFRAQAELSRMQSDVLTAQQEVASALARLNWLLDRKPWTELGELEPPPFPEVTWTIAALRARALTERPEVLASKALEGKTEADRKLAFKRFFPDFLIGYEWTRIGSGSTMASFDGKDAHGFKIGLNLPVWGGANKASIREAQAKEKAASLSSSEVANRTLYELEDLSVRAETSVQKAKVDEDTILPQIRAALKATLSGYESDSVGFLDLLDVERTLLNLELQHLRHEVMFRKLVAEMERVVGGEI